MNKFNIFNSDSALYPLRWLIVSSLAVIVFISWINLSGRRLFNTTSQEQWSSSGPGYHK